MKWGMVLTPEAKENLKLLEPAYKATLKYCKVFQEGEGECNENCPLHGSIYIGNAGDEMGECLMDALRNFTHGFDCYIIDENDEIINEDEEEEDDSEDGWYEGIR
jgi:hypothetical protein